MKKKILLFLKILISGVLVYLVFRFSDLDLKKTLIVLKTTDPLWASLSLVFISATIFTNAYRWMILANLLDYNLTYSKALRMYFESSFTNNVLPTNFGGDAIRAFDLGRTDKSWLRAASTVLMERFLGFSMMFSLVPIGLITSKFTRFKDCLPLPVETALWASFTMMVFSVIGYGLWSKIPLGFIQKIKYAITQYTKCHKSLSKVILWTFITHVFFISGCICSGLAVGLSFSVVPWWYWLVFIPSATLASFVIPSIKGAGAREVSFIYFLNLISVSGDKALAIAIIGLLATMISTLPGISIVFRKMKLGAVVQEEATHEQEELEKITPKKSSKKPSKKPKAGKTAVSAHSSTYTEE
jgi:uncharacterized protein (TIRG00374 family)